VCRSTARRRRRLTPSTGCSSPWAQPQRQAHRAEAAGVTTDGHGFIPVDKQLRTNVAHIFAIGDVVGQPMLAHKAMHEGSGSRGDGGEEQFLRCPRHPVGRLHRSRGGLAGVTENEARARDHVRQGVFPWAASGRSLTLGRSEGLTKVLFTRERPHHRLRHRRANAATSSPRRR